MTTYEVTVEVEPGLIAAFTRYMLEQHLPEILATGCRVRADFMARFPAGCTASRETWEAVRAFGEAAG
jgi:hypothetical protein